MVIDQKPKYKNFIIVTISVLVIISILHNATAIEKILTHYFNLVQFNFLVKIGGIILSFIMLNTSYYSLMAHRRTRMLFFVLIFEGYAILEILGTIFYNNLFVDFSRVTISLFSIYYEVGMMILAVYLAIASVIDFEEKLKFKYQKIIRWAPVLEFGALMLAVYIVMSSYGLLTNQDIFIGVAHVVQFVSVAFTIIMYLSLYQRIKNRSIRYFASGLVILLIANVYETSIAATQFQIMVGHLFVMAGIWTMNHATFRYNIEIPYIQLVNAKKQINLYAENLEKIVSRRTREIVDVNKQLVAQIENAKKIQQSLLPSKRYYFKNTLFVSEYIPCDSLSGDFYDIYQIDDENLGMYVLDVSGHGISAALMTMFCNNYVKSSERLIKRYRGLKPHRNIQHFYDEFNKMSFPDEMHMVIFFASYNVKTRLLKYSNGGLNNFPILFKKDGQVKLLDQNIGFPICKMSDIYIPEYESTHIQLEIGDRVIFFTDGLIDERKNQIMTEEELIEGFINHKNDNLDDLNSALLNRIAETEKTFEDDITYFIMEIQ